MKQTKAPNGADRGKYNAYQREYKWRKRMAARGGGSADGGDGSVHVAADPGTAGVPGGGGVGGDGLGCEAAELGDVSRLPSARRGIEFEVDASAVGPAKIVSEIYARIRPR